MESYEKPANCWSLQCATHDQMIRAVDQQMTELFMATAPQGKSKTATTLMESTDRTALVSVQSREPPGITLSCMPPAANQDQPIKSKHLTFGKQKISAAETMPPAQQTIYQQACEQCATCCLISYCTQMFIWSTRRRVDITPLAGKQLTEDLELESQRNAHRRLT